MRRAIGETAGSAYRGDRGKTAYDHSQVAHAPAGAQANIIESVTFNGEAIVPVAKTVTIPGIANAALVAALEGLSYAITYELDGGVNDPSNPETFTLSVLPLVLAPATRDGYTFLGWFEEITLETEVTQFTTFGAKTVYAGWAFDITYELNGGVNDGANPATFVTGDLPITLLDPTKADHTFIGWYEEAEFTTPITEISAAADITIYAKFEEIFDITYVLDGGTNGANPATFIEDDLDIPLLDATKDLYTFNGWFEEAEFTTPITLIDTAADITVYAKFTII